MIFTIFSKYFFKDEVKNFQNILMQVEVLLKVCEQQMVLGVCGANLHVCTVQVECWGNLICIEVLPAIGNVNSRLNA